MDSKRCQEQNAMNFIIIIFIEQYHIDFILNCSPKTGHQIFYNDVCYKLSLGTQIVFKIFVCPLEPECLRLFFFIL